MEYFTIERKNDNSDANNWETIKDMIGFLKIRQCIGIFPEGITCRPKGNDFGTFDMAFVRLAKMTDALVQPVTIL